MGSSLIVARMNKMSAQEVGSLFTAFDQTEMPRLMGTTRRQLFTFRGLYFHLQDFVDDEGEDRIESAKRDPRFVRISEDLKPYISPFDPVTWRSPKDALATRFYDWSSTDERS